MPFKCSSRYWPGLSSEAQVGRGCKGAVVGEGVGEVVRISGANL